MRVLAYHLILTNYGFWLPNDPRGSWSEFVRAWELHEVAQRYDACKTVVHPELGRIDVDGQVLFTENRAQRLVVLTTRTGTESHSKLELLSVIGHQQLTR